MHYPDGEPERTENNFSLAALASVNRVRCASPKAAGWLVISLLTMLPVTAASQSPGQPGADQSARTAPGPVTVRADYARFSQRDGTGLYEGNAELEQGERRLTADRIRLYTENGELTRVEAEGSPLVLTEGDTLSARARHLEYDVTGQRIILKEEAHIRHLDRTFEGARIDYDLATRQVEASGEGDSRVRLVIPGQDAGKSEGDKHDNQ